MAPSTLHCRRLHRLLKSDATAGFLTQSARELLQRRLGLGERALRITRRRRLLPARRECALLLVRQCLLQRRNLATPLRQLRAQFAAPFDRLLRRLRCQVQLRLQHAQVASTCEKGRAHG